MNKQLTLTPTTNGQSQNVPSGREITQQQRNLPSLEELRDESHSELWAKDNALNVLLNSDPPDKWMLKHKTITRDVNGKKEPYFYLPVGRLEWLMTRIFVNWHVEILTVQLLANSVCVTVRVHYQDPVTSQWKWTDGVGATPLQTASGAGAVDFNALKSAAVQMAAPAAESYAFKDAVEKLGNLFGKDIARTSQMDYMGLLGQFDSQPISVMEADTIRNLLKAGNGNENNFLEYIGASSIEEIRKTDYKKAIAQLNQKANS
jgi:hypothetical protein